MQTALLLLISYLQQQLIIQSADLDPVVSSGLLPSLAVGFALLQMLLNYRRNPVDVRALRTLLDHLPDGRVRHMLRCALKDEPALGLFDQGLVMVTRGRKTRELTDEPQAS